MRWPDLHRLAVAYLRPALGDVRVVTRVPGNLADVLPVVRVTRGPGSDDGITDAPLLDVEVFAADEGAMWTLAEDARQAMHALAGQSVDGALVDSVTTSVGPVAVDYGNPAAHRAVASYRVEMRQQAL